MSIISMMIGKLVLLLMQTTTAKKVPCDGIVFHEVYYDKELLFTDFGKPYNLIMHKFSGLLFFSHTIQNKTHADFKISSCKLEKKTCMDIKNVNGGYAIAYDSGNDDIYFGGHSGIYKYNFLTKTAELFGEEGKDIWSIFVKRNFYYIQYPKQSLHVYQNDEFVPVAEATGMEIDQFFISKQMHIYLSNRTALYKIIKPIKEAIMLNDVIEVRQIVEDTYGDVYFCAKDGIYVEDKPYLKLKKLANIKNVYGMAFDENDNIIYSDSDSIYRLLPSKNSDICYWTLKVMSTIGKKLRRSKKKPKSHG